MSMAHNKYSECVESLNEWVNKWNEWMSHLPWGRSDIWCLCSDLQQKGTQPGWVGEWNVSDLGWCLLIPLGHCTHWFLYNTPPRSHSDLSLNTPSQGCYIWSPYPHFQDPLCFILLPCSFSFPVLLSKCYDFLLLWSVSPNNTGKAVWVSLLHRRVPTRMSHSASSIRICWVSEYMNMTPNLLWSLSVAPPQSLGLFLAQQNPFGASSNIKHLKNFSSLDIITPHHVSPSPLTPSCFPSFSYSKGPTLQPLDYWLPLIVVPPQNGEQCSY